MFPNVPVASNAARCEIPIDSAVVFDHLTISGDALPNTTPVLFTCSPRLEASVIAFPAATPIAPSAPTAGRNAFWVAPAIFELVLPRSSLAALSFSVFARYSTMICGLAI